MTPSFSFTDISSVDPLQAACELYARSLQYDRASRHEQKRFGADLKAGAYAAPYHPALLAKVYDMAHAFLANWTDVSHGGRPWETKTPRQKAVHVAQAMKAYDADGKRNHFHKPSRTSVLLKPIAEVDCYMGARRHGKSDLLCVTEEGLAGTESWVAACVVHENVHLLTADFHEDSDKVFEEAAMYGVPFADRAVAALYLSEDAGYDAQWRCASDEITRHLIKACQGGLPSPAFICEKAMARTRQADKRFNWYVHSPEESLARVAQLYAALTMNEKMNLPPETGLIESIMNKSNYTDNRAGQMMFAHIEQRDPAKSFAALGF